MLALWTDLLADAGIQDPRSFDEVLQRSRARSARLRSHAQTAESVFLLSLLAWALGPTDTSLGRLCLVSLLAAWFFLPLAESVVAQGRQAYLFKYILLSSTARADGVFRLVPFVERTSDIRDMLSDYPATAYAYMRGPQASRQRKRKRAAVAAIRALECRNLVEAQPESAGEQTWRVTALGSTMGHRIAEAVKDLS